MRFFTLFIIFTYCGLKFFAYSLHPKQYVVPDCFPIFIRFYLWLCIFHVLHYQFLIIIFSKIINNCLLNFLIFYFCLLILLFLLSTFFSFSFINCFSNFFIFDCVFFIFCNLVKCFWHIVLILLILSLQLFFQSLQ